MFFEFPSLFCSLPYFRESTANNYSFIFTPWKRLPLSSLQHDVYKSSCKLRANSYPLNSCLALLFLFFSHSLSVSWSLLCCTSLDLIAVVMMKSKSITKKEAQTQVATVMRESSSSPRNRRWKKSLTIVMLILLESLYRIRRLTNAGLSTTRGKCIVYVNLDAKFWVLSFFVYFLKKNGVFVNFRVWERLFFFFFLNWEIKTNRCTVCWLSKMSLKHSHQLVQKFMFILT